MNSKFTPNLILLALLAICFSAQAQEQILTVNSPSSITGTFEMGEPVQEGWTGQLGIGESVTGDLAIVQADVMDDDDVDGDTPPMGCVMLANPDEMEGKIALIQRGSCSFSAKINFAQEAGAIGVIICNNNPGNEIVNMLASEPYLDMAMIPAGFITLEDCAAINETVESGETVNVTINLQEFADLSAAYCYETPQKNIVPLNDIGVTVYVADSINYEVTWVITDPNNVETTLTTSGDILPGATTFIVDEPYIPEAIGEYTVVCTNSVNDRELTTSFIITDEDVFAMDNRNVVDGVGPNSGEGWTTPATGIGSVYDASMVIRTGDTELQLQSFEFGVENWAELLEGAQSNPSFIVQVYDADPDGDGVISDPPATATSATTLYDEFGTAITFNIHDVTGDETDFVSVDFSAFGGEYPILPPNKAYLISVQYRGEEVGNGIAPSYLYGGNINYRPALQSAIVTTGWFSGWIGAPAIALRTTAPEAPSNVENILLANEVQLTPNPTNGELQLNFDLAQASSTVNVVLYNLNGQALLNQKAENMQTGSMSFDLANIASGTYFMHIATDEGFTFKKFVKK